MRQRRQRIERIEQTALGRNLRHELRDPLGTGAADDALVELAFLPDQAREKSGRQPVNLRDRCERVAERVRRNGGRGDRRAFRLGRVREFSLRRILRRYLPAQPRSR